VEEVYIAFLGAGRVCQTRSRRWADLKRASKGIATIMMWHVR